jgi:glycosyltransferase involved in cell wall biosynthesis
METIAALAPRFPEVQFDIFGGHDADVRHWRETCSQMGNIVLHGFIPQSAVALKMTECDILIAPYGKHVTHVGGGDIARWMSPLKLFEYMAAERPIVTSDMPVLREVVRDGETALLCPPGDLDAFASALRRLLHDSSLRDRLGSAARALLEAKYTWDERVRRVTTGIDLPVNGEGG